jgi:hypothetical protein
MLIVPVAAVGRHLHPVAAGAGHPHRPAEAEAVGGDGRRAGSWGRGRQAAEAARNRHPVEAVAVDDGHPAGLWDPAHRHHLAQVGHIPADFPVEVLSPAGLATTPPMFPSKDIPLPLRRFAFS